jgi:DNA-binding CsgD family transcriptional regulator
MELRIASAVPVFAVGSDQTIVAWNEAAEELTGIPADAALGEPCWVVLAGRRSSGELVCHRQCSCLRHAFAGWPVQTETIDVQGTDGTRRVAVDHVAVQGHGDGLLLHLLSGVPAGSAAAERDRPAAEPGPSPRLTPRQLEVVRLLGEGVPARSIASRLGIAEATVRNHIRAILVELGAHSQLEAVFVARSYALL